MPFNTYLDGTTEPTALRYAPKLGYAGLTTSTTPTANQGNQYWADAFAKISVKLAIAGWAIPITYTASSRIEDMLQKIEALYTSAYALRSLYGHEHGNIPDDVTQLLAEADAELEMLAGTSSTELAALGVTSSVPDIRSIRSFWTETATERSGFTDARDIGPQNRVSAPEDSF